MVFALDQRDTARVSVVNVNDYDWDARKWGTTLDFEESIGSVLYSGSAMIVAEHGQVVSPPYGASHFRLWDSSTRMNAVVIGCDYKVLALTEDLRLQIYDSTAAGDSPLVAESLPLGLDHVELVSSSVGAFLLANSTTLYKLNTQNWMSCN